MSRYLMKSIASFVLVLSLCCSSFVSADEVYGDSGEANTSQITHRSGKKKPMPKNTHLLNILILGEDGTLNGSTRKAICALGESIGIFDVDLKSDKAEELGLSEEGTVIVRKDFTSYYAMNIRGMKKIGEDLDESMMRSCHYVVCPLEIKSSDKIEDLEARIRNLWNPIRAKNQYCGMYFMLVCDEGMTKKDFETYCKKFSVCCVSLQKESFFKKNTEWIPAKGRQSVWCTIVELKADDKLDLKSFLEETKQWGRERITDVEKNYGVKVVDLGEVFELPKIEPPKVKLPRIEPSRANPAKVESPKIEVPNLEYSEEEPLIEDPEESILILRREPFADYISGSEEVKSVDGLFKDEVYSRTKCKRCVFAVGASAAALGTIGGIISLYMGSSKRSNSFTSESDLCGLNATLCSGLTTCLEQVCCNKSVACVVGGVSVGMLAVAAGCMIYYFL